MTPQVRTATTHVGTALGAATATAMWLATKGVDLYAIIDQLNTVVVAVGKLAALVMPIATGAYGVYKATTKQKLLDIQADPAIKGVVTMPTVAGREIADSIPGPLVVAAGTVEAASIAAR